jgi:hypothetical protein
VCWGTGAAAPREALAGKRQSGARRVRADGAQLPGSARAHGPRPLLAWSRALPVSLSGGAGAAACWARARAGKQTQRLAHVVLWVHPEAAPRLWSFAHTLHPFARPLTPRATLQPPSRRLTPPFVVPAPSSTLVYCPSRPSPGPRFAPLLCCDAGVQRDRCSCPFGCPDDQSMPRSGAGPDACDVMPARAHAQTWPGAGRRRPQHACPALRTARRSRPAVGSFCCGRKRAGAAGIRARPPRPRMGTWT